MTAQASSPRLDAKLFYRRLDSLFGSLDTGGTQGALLKRFLTQAFEVLRDDLRLRAALLYAERRDGFALVQVAGDPGAPVADELDRALPALHNVFRHRVYIYADPAADDSPYRAGWLPNTATATVLIGRRPKRYLLSFVLADGWIREELDFALNTVRAALGSRMVDERVRRSFHEAAEIQQSLLMDEPPDFPGYDLACRSLPAEEVGGDFYDFHSFGDDLLGLSIGDASGHGLPAALLVRDVVTGLRMGIEKNLKVAYVFHKLNRVIHRSSLSSRFISVFYGELERNGTLVYCNAGHPPPLVIHEGRVERLETGGMVIGPMPEIEFQRGIAVIPEGGVLVLSTDGVLERRDAEGSFFGEEGLLRVVSESAAQGAEEILDRILAAADAHGRRKPYDDDATLVVVKRLPA
jgi:sigma-B regulation protein RsbU (phosphoserine phosphatase)